MLTQDLARKVFAVVYTFAIQNDEIKKNTFAIFIHSLSSVHLFHETAQNRPLTAVRTVQRFSCCRQANPRFSVVTTELFRVRRGLAVT